MVTDPPSGPAPSWGKSRGPPTPRLSASPPSTRSGSQEGLPTPAKFQLKTSERPRVPEPLHACLQRGRVRDALGPRGSPELFPSLSRPSRVPGPPVRGFSSPWAGKASLLSGSNHPSRAPSLRGALALLTPPGCRAEAGPAAEPPPTASPARRAGGWLGRLHLLFLKRRGADERHHSSPGPGHRHTRCPAFSRGSSS